MAGSLFRTAQRCRPIRMVDSGSPPGPIFHPMEQAGSSSRTGRAAYRTVHGATSAPEASPPRSVVSVKPAVRPTARRPHDPLNCHLLPRAFVKSVEPERSRSGPAVVDNGLARVRFGIPCPASVASGRSCLPALSGRSSDFSGVPFGNRPGFWFSSAESRLWNPRAEDAQLVTPEDQAW